MPVDRVDHRWLSSFAAAGTMLFLFEALVLFYFAWVPEDMKSVYQQDIDELLSQFSTAVKKRVKIIQKVCHKKSLTKAGKEQKERVVEKLLFNRKKTEIQFNFCHNSTTFQIICTCAWTEQAHDASYSWWAYFSCPPFLHLFSENPDTSRHLLNSQFDVTKAENQLLINQWHIGTDPRQILRKLPADHPIKTEFYKAMKQAFELASPYIQVSTQQQRAEDIDVYRPSLPWYNNWRNYHEG